MYLHQFFSGGVTSTRGVGKGTNELIIQLIEHVRQSDERNDRQERMMEKVLTKVLFFK